MKRLLIFISFIILATVITYSCERDDICAETTQTTPRLIIEFYDATEPELLKNVPRITVYGEGLITDPIDANSQSIVLGPDAINNIPLFNVNTNKIELPLKIGMEGETTTSRFILEKDTNLRLDTDNPETSNIDIIEITYQSEFIYVSRACGYKSIFTNINVTREPSTIDSDRWISNLEIEDTIELTVENENTTHVRIYH